jgi:CRP-like cAMP-binding protein
MARRDDPKLEALKAVPLFDGLKKKDLVAIGKLADEIDLPAGKQLIGEGGLGTQFFILLEGEVEVRRGGERLATLRDGDFFGEISLLSDSKTTATVETTTPVRVAVITRSAFGKLLRDAPKVQWTVMQALVKRVPADETFTVSAP